MNTSTTHFHLKRDGFSTSACIFLILTGALIGIVSYLVLSKLFTRLSVNSLMSIVAATAGIFLFLYCLLLFFRFLQKHSLLKECGLFFKLLVNKPLKTSWPDHIKKTTEENVDVIRKIVMSIWPVWAASAILSPIIVVCFSFASFLSSLSQVEVIEAQNSIVARTQKFALAQAEADKQYEFLLNVLTNRSASPQEQSYALSELPKSMISQVPVYELDETHPVNSSIIQETSFPNRARLRSVLGQFLRRDRVAEFHEQTGHDFPISRFMSTDKMDKLNPLGHTSTELILCLNSLGPVEGEKSTKLKTQKGKQIDYCLWNWDPLKSKKKPPSLRPRPNRGDAAIIDLSFVMRGQLTNLCLPLLNPADRWQVVFRNGANIRNAKLQAATLKNCLLRFSNVAEADCRMANLEEANLVGSDFSDSNLEMANLRNAQLEGSKFKSTKLTGLNFSGCQFAPNKLNGSALGFSNSSKEKEFLIPGAVFLGIADDMLEDIQLVGIHNGKICKATFANSEGAVWMDKTSLNSFLNSLENEYHKQLSKSNLLAKKAVDKLKEELERIESPNKYGASWQENIEKRWAWSLISEYED